MKRALVEMGVGAANSLTVVILPALWLMGLCYVFLRSVIVGRL
jgi:hypothetical protein